MSRGRERGRGGDGDGYFERVAKGARGDATTFSPIACSRRPDGTFYQDHDDDGETAAGGRLLRLLVLADARNVVVVVSRWYGGVHLGPARFHVINTAAKVALESLGEIHQST